jgi:sugar (pentulose or hexulose) kinase
MNRIPIIAIFDVGKTNKKILLFDEQYKLLYEENKQLEEIKDEDGFSCEDVDALTGWVKRSFELLLKDERYDIRGINFSAYGASFVYLDGQLKVFLPLYNYLKPCSSKLKEKFYATYGGESDVTKKTASPVLGNLNSGMQLYRLKYEKPQTFSAIKYALHLPQYLSFIFTGKLSSDITSIGCHTNLWDFETNKYHSWVKKEGVLAKLASIENSNDVAGYVNENIPVGIGLHDSSAALVPYFISFNEPFILLSTGTWCITLNPFNDMPLNDYELQQDCLCYLSYLGKAVKASRLFAGYEHEQQTKNIAAHFNKSFDYYKTVQYNLNILQQIKPVNKNPVSKTKDAMLGQPAFGARELKQFTSYEGAYHQLIADIVEQQIQSTNLVLKGTAVKRIFVDGGFSNNTVYMNLLAAAFSGIEVYAASVPQASALGAALAIHRHWNSKPLPLNIIELKYYTAKQEKLNY